MRRIPVVVATVAASALALTSCAGSSSGSASQSPSLPAAAKQDAVAGTVAVAAQPGDQGQALINLLNSATTSIDIPIYQIGDPTIQAALIAALQRNVAVRVMMDGSSTSQVNYKNGPTAKALSAAAQAAGVPAGRLQLHWSSNNFNITHQKSVIIDALDASGAPLAAGAMPATARLMVSTGNFLTTTYKGVTSPYYSARDYYVTIDDQNLIGAAETVFSSDFRCDGRTTTNNLKDATGLVWSNGTTGKWSTDAAGEYPSPAEGYFNNSLTPGSPVDQGNADTNMLALLNTAGAGDIVRVSSEELKDTGVANDILTKLGSLAAAGADVRLVMSFSTTSFVLSDLENLARQGVRVTLLANQDQFPQALYIHGKLMTVTKPDGTANGIVGSQNLSSPSLTWNRELGLDLDPSDAQALTSLNTTFDTDFNSTDFTTQLTKANPTTIPASWLASPSPTPSAATVGCDAQ